MEHDNNIVYRYVDICSRWSRGCKGRGNTLGNNTALYALGAVTHGGLEAGERVLGEGS